MKRSRRTALIVRGAARALDMSGSGRVSRAARTEQYVKRSDEAALAADWKIVGDDLRGAIRRVDRSALTR
jgi:hypothetical protein